MYKNLTAFVSLVLFLFFSTYCFGKNLVVTEKKDPLQENIALGRQIYRQGILANGNPVEAYVMGDIKVLGTQFTCLNCHGRSGMGGGEGKTFTLAINPAALFTPRDSMYLERSAYDDESLAASIRQGETPEGIALTPEMPTYNLPDREMAALVAYLKTLSSKFSPGLTDGEIHFATVVSDGVNPADRTAMLAVMNAFFKDKNATTRNEKKRSSRGPFYQTYRLKAYRRWVLHVWALHGPAETWPAQLNQYQSKQPVFALLGGMVQGSWQPIHTFCEKNEIPSLLPNTDWPGGIGTDDFYTLYFSEGLQLEAGVIVTDLVRQKRPVRVLQVYKTGSTGEFGARSIEKKVEGNQLISISNWQLKPGAEFSQEKLLALISQTATDTVILWLPEKEITRIHPGNFTKMMKGYVYLSSSLLNGIFPFLATSPKTKVKLAHPFILPKNQQSVFKRISPWLRIRKIPRNRRRILGQTYYACMMLGEGLMHIKRHFYRDYLLDALDHGNAKSIFSINYPRLSYGPGQRYLAKGAFLLKNTTDNKITATWIVPHL